MFNRRTLLKGGVASLGWLLLGASKQTASSNWCFVDKVYAISGQQGRHYRVALINPKATVFSASGHRILTRKGFVRVEELKHGDQISVAHVLSDGMFYCKTRGE